MNSDCIEFDIESNIHSYFKAKKLFDLTLKSKGHLNVLRSNIKRIMYIKRDMVINIKGPAPTITNIKDLIKHVHEKNDICNGIFINIKVKEINKNMECLKQLYKYLTENAIRIDFQYFKNPWIKYLYQHPFAEMQDVMRQAEKQLSLKYGFKYNVEEFKRNYNLNQFDQDLEDRLIESILKHFYVTLRLELKSRLEAEGKVEERSVSRCLFLNHVIEFMKNENFERFIYLHDSIKFITESHSVNIFMVKLLGQLELLPGCEK